GRHRFASWRDHRAPLGRFVTRHGRIVLSRGEDSAIPRAIRPEIVGVARVRYLPAVSAWQTLIRTGFLSLPPNPTTGRFATNAAFTIRSKPGSKRSSAA